MSTCRRTLVRTQWQAKVLATYPTAFGFHFAVIVDSTHRLLDTLSKNNGSTYRTCARASTAASVSGCSSPRTVTTTSGSSGFVAASEQASLCACQNSKGVSVTPA